MSVDAEQTGFSGRAPDELEADTSDTVTPQRSNRLKSTVILAKTIIGAGIAALPLSNVMLGWPLALIFLLMVAYSTHLTLDILVRAITANCSPSYSEVVLKTLGLWTSLLLEVAIVVFGIGLMLVYEVVIGDMLVGKVGYPGLLCGPLGGIFCSRAFVVGIVTLLVLVPAVSFRSLESSAFASWVGMSALLAWALGTLILLVAAAIQGQVQPPRLLPDLKLLGGSGAKVLANICAVVPVLTTAYSCQAAAPFVMAELRPDSPATKKAVSMAAVAITTALYALISLGSYLVFGDGVQSDVLHNYTPAALEGVVPPWLAQTLYVAVRLSFMLAVVTLFPLMVTYGITAAVYLVSVVTPSIWGPIQFIGATAGAVIGFIVPGLLAFKEPSVENREAEEPLVDNGSTKKKDWRLKSVTGWSLLIVGIVQCFSVIVSQVL